MNIESMQSLTVQEDRSQVVANRNYLFMGLASLLAVTAIMYVRSEGSAIAAIIPTLIGATGFLLSWRLVPGLYILALSYFIVSPFGQIVWWTGSSDVFGSGFRFLDILLAAAVLLSLAALVRYMSMKSVAMPNDVSRSQVRKSRTKRVRPDSIVHRDEFMQLFVSIGLFTLAGQLLWIIVASLHVDALNIPPFTMHGDVFLHVTPLDARAKASYPLDRFLITIGIVSFVTLTLTTIFWYWKISRLSGIEARMALLDTGWYENRRELNRQAKWIAWADPRNVTIKRPKPPRKGISIGRFVVVVISILVIACILMLFVLGNFIA